MQIIKMLNEAEDFCYIKCHKCNRFFTSSLKEDIIDCTCGSEGTVVAMRKSYKFYPKRIKEKDLIAVRIILNLKKFNKKYPDFKKLAERISSFNKY